MVSYEKYIEKFPTLADLEKAYPVGKKIVWCDRMTYTIVCYHTDRTFNKKDDCANIVVIRTWSKHKRCWYYSTVDAFVFYSTVEMMERELKEDRKRKAKEKK